MNNNIMFSRSPFHVHGKSDFAGQGLISDTKFKVINVRIDENCALFTVKSDETFFVINRQGSKWINSWKFFIGDNSKIPEKIMKKNQLIGHFIFIL